MTLQLWDYDPVLRNTLIATYVLPRSALHHGSSSRPHLAPRWLNFYGPPRAVTSTTFDKARRRMTAGLMKGVDYRGRVLVGMKTEGLRSNNNPTASPSSERDEVTAHIAVRVDVRSVSLLPREGYFKVKVMLGSDSATSRVVETRQMRQGLVFGEGDVMHCADFNEELRMDHVRVSVCVPPAAVGATNGDSHASDDDASASSTASSEGADDVAFTDDTASSAGGGALDVDREESSHYSAVTASSVASRRSSTALPAADQSAGATPSTMLAFWEQVPAIVVHLIDESSGALKFMTDAIDYVNNTLDEVPVAATLLACEKIHEAGHAVHFCRAMHLAHGGASLHETAPLLHCYVTLILKKTTPPHDRVRPTPASSRLERSIIPRLLMDDSERRRRDRRGEEPPPPPPAPRRYYCLECNVYRARGLPAVEGSDTAPDPYVVVSWGDGMSRTGVQQRTQSPVFNETLHVVSHGLVGFRHPDVVVDVWDRQRIGRDRLLCRAVVSYDKFVTTIPPSTSSSSSTSSPRQLIGASSVLVPRWVEKWTDVSGERVADPQCGVLLTMTLRDEQFVFERLPMKTLASFHSHRAVLHRRLAAQRTAAESAATPTTTSAQVVGTLFRPLDAAVTVIRNRASSVAARVGVPGFDTTYTGYPIAAEATLPLATYSVEVRLVALREMRRLRFSREVTRPLVEVCVEDVSLRMKKPARGANANLDTDLCLAVELPDDSQHLPDMLLKVYEQGTVGPRQLIGVARVSLTHRKANRCVRRNLITASDEAARHRANTLLHLITQDGECASAVDTALVTPVRRRWLPRLGAVASPSPARTVTDVVTPAPIIGGHSRLSEFRQRLAGGDDDDQRHTDVSLSTIAAVDASGARDEASPPPTADPNDVGDADDDHALDVGAALEAAQRERDAKSLVIPGSGDSDAEEAKVPLWYERYDAGGATALLSDDVSTHVVVPHIPVTLRVARLSQYVPRIGSAASAFAATTVLTLSGHPAGAAAASPINAVEATAEAMFGPFHDENVMTLDLLRPGATPHTSSQVEPSSANSRLRVGSLVCEINVEKQRALPLPRSTLETHELLQGLTAVTFQGPSELRPRVNFVARVYVIGCRDLVAPRSRAQMIVDRLTSAATQLVSHASRWTRTSGTAAAEAAPPPSAQCNPYVTLSLRSSSGASSERRLVDRFSGNLNGTAVSCRDDAQTDEPNPDFFLVREVCGVLPQHDTLRITLVDKHRVGLDEDIGWTDVRIGDRYYSPRGYSWTPTPRPRRGVASDTGDEGPARDAREHYHLSRPGSYVETRTLRNSQGAVTGTVNMWVDVFDTSSPAAIAALPRPIDIQPPPPVAIELRAVIWNVRDVAATPSRNHAGVRGALSRGLQRARSAVRMDDGPPSMDFYVRCRMQGMPSNTQQTDVHHGSLDGSGSFHWRTVFPLFFDPRTCTVSRRHTDAEDGPVLSAARRLGSVLPSRRRDESKRKAVPRLHLLVLENNALPGSDTALADTTLDLTELRPCVSRRRAGELRQRVAACSSSMRNCCTWFCRRQTTHHSSAPQDDDDDDDDNDRLREEAAQRERLDRCVDDKMELLVHSGRFSDAQLARMRRRIALQVRRENSVNAFQSLLPTRTTTTKHGNGIRAQRGPTTDADGMPVGHVTTTGPSLCEAAHTETSPMWFACWDARGRRAGDVQLSFQVVDADLIRRDARRYAAGKGRSGPQALPVPDRPADRQVSAFMWLSSPWKAALRLGWERYRRYLLTVVCIALVVGVAYLFLSTGIKTRARVAFE